ncbi:protein ALP1-like [Cryptomeria japonica]|uniref:protein ALP1-like n=1 Tax=Cryptomeria japonica TaxID=3369 RepID=UPI0025ACA0DA|nr:protein ALP1-like [Cryptomeria japonica]XP_057819016.1 protein ALP1-like [Cryptomeria japonica]
MDQSLRQILQGIVAGTAQALEVTMQAWSVLEDSTTSEYLMESLENAPPYNTVLKGVNQYSDEITEEDTTMDIIAANTLSEQNLLTSSELSMSDWDGKVPNECIVKPQSVDWWNHYSFHVSSDDLRFQTIFSLPIQLFDELCHLLYDDLCQGPIPISFAMSIKNRVLSVEKQVAMAILRLSSGMTMLTVSELFDCGKSTVVKVVKKFIFSMQKRASKYIQWPTDAASLEHIKEGFRLKQGFPNCCGAIDATHVKLELPYNESSIDWYNREHNYSMLVQAIVDSNMRFLDICTGWPGSLNDSGLLRNSSFYKLCEEGERLNGPPVSLGGFDMREYIIGDGAYPLLPWLIVPFSGETTDDQRLFNYKLSYTRNVVERAFAKLRSTWQLLQTKIKKPNMEMLPRTILACCILQNMLLSMEAYENEIVDEIIDESDTSLQGMEMVDVDPAAATAQIALMDYVNNIHNALED